MFEDLEDDSDGGRFSQENLTGDETCENPILASPLKAIDLVGRVIGRYTDSRQEGRSITTSASELRVLWLKFLEDLKGMELAGHIVFYNKAMSLCDKLIDYPLAKLLHNKTILGIGGQFSAGKSAFINAVVGLGNLLPEDMNPTTSIPTFVTKAQTSRYLLTSMRGRVTQEMSSDEINALTHAFHDKYKIGFSAFIDSCIISSPDFRISPNIVLLDTPGYSKPDDLERTFTLSDRQRALEQLKRADRLIWLIHHECGTLSQEDISFINDIHHTEPILIVITRADLVSDKHMEEIIESTRQMSSSLNCEVFGITGYSSPYRAEYGNRHIIQDFLEDVEKKADGRSDVIHEFSSLEDDIYQALIAIEKKESLRVRELKKYIANTIEVLAIKSLSFLLNRARRRLRLVRGALKNLPDAKAQRQELLESIINSEQ